MNWSNVTSANPFPFKLNSRKSAAVQNAAAVYANVRSVAIQIAPYTVCMAQTCEQLTRSHWVSVVSRRNRDVTPVASTGSCRMRLPSSKTHFHRAVRARIVRAECRHLLCQLQSRQGSREGSRRTDERHAAGPPGESAADQPAGPGAGNQGHAPALIGRWLHDSGCRARPTPKGGYRPTAPSRATRYRTFDGSENGRLCVRITRLFKLD